MPKLSPEDSRAADLLLLEYATPALRTLLAVVIYLRFGGLQPGEDEVAMERAYSVADAFIETLKEDYKA